MIKHTFHLNGSLHPQVISFDQHLHHSIYVTTQHPHTQPTMRTTITLITLLLALVPFSQACKCLKSDGDNVGQNDAATTEACCTGTFDAGSGDCNADSISDSFNNFAFCCGSEAIGGGEALESDCFSSKMRRGAVRPFGSGF